MDYNKDAWKEERSLLVDQIMEQANQEGNDTYAYTLLKKGITRSIDEMFAKETDKADFLAGNSRPNIADLASKSKGTTINDIKRNINLKISDLTVHCAVNGYMDHVSELRTIAGSGIESMKKEELINTYSRLLDIETETNIEK